MEYGIILGVALSIGIYLIRPMRPQIQSTIVAPHNYLLVKPEQGFFFPSVDHVRTHINSQILSDSSIRLIVLDCEQMLDMDYTGTTALCALHGSVNKTGRELVFVNFNRPCWELKFEAVGFSSRGKHVFLGKDEFVQFLESRHRPGSCNSEVANLMITLEP